MEVCTSAWSCLTEVYATHNFKTWSWFLVPSLTEFGFGLVWVWAVQACSSVNSDRAGWRFGASQLNISETCPCPWISIVMDTPKQPVAQVWLKSRCLWFLLGSQLKAQGSFQVSWVCFCSSFGPFPFLSSLSAIQSLLSPESLEQPNLTKARQSHGSFGF